MRVVILHQDDTHEAAQLFFYQDRYPAFFSQAIRFLPGIQVL